MATITGLTADRMLEIEAASVVDGDIVGDDLILTRKDGSIINAGNVRGPQGNAGPMGSPVSVISDLLVNDVGVINQIRAGRQLSVADFTNMGLSVPIGLYNLSNFNDVSGNARALTNKGAVPQVDGINGVASTALGFVGNPAQVAYRADTGALDPFRIRTGSWGCWFRCPRRGVNQTIISKRSGSTLVEFYNQILTTNVLTGVVSIAGDFVTWGQVTGISDVCDDRWHFGVTTFDGSRLCLYVDGVMEGVNLITGGMFASSAPFNIGGYGGDASNNAVEPVFGRVDEAFVTGDVLTPDQVRNLYCASIPHALAAVPSAAYLSVRRRRRGPVLATTDFPSQPLRLHNFVNGALTDQGSNGQILTNPGYAVSAGPDGTPAGSFAILGGGGLSATDANLPSGTGPRSFGAWVKTTLQGGTLGLISWGSGASSAAGAWLGMFNGNVGAQSAADPMTAGAFIADGLWHFVVTTEENAPADGIKRKVYCDGRLCGQSLVLGSIALGGATRFRIGSSADGANPFSGMMSRVFVVNVALTADQIRALYNLGTQEIAPNPKAVSDHVEAFEAGRILALFDSADTVDQIDLAVAA